MLTRNRKVRRCFRWRFRHWRRPVRCWRLSCSPTTTGSVLPNRRILVAVVGVALVLMLLATPILKVIGTSGAAIVSRVMGMILAAVAVDNVIAAVLELIKTNTV